MQIMPRKKFHEANKKRRCEFMEYKKEQVTCHMTSLNPEVTGSLHYVTVKKDLRTINFIVDCGLYQEKAYNELNSKKFPFYEEKVDFVLITHNHADHMGRLPYLVNGGFTGKIYATRDTSKLMKIALEDSFKIEKEEARKQKRPLMYDLNDFENTLNQIVPCNFEEVQYVDKNVKVTFFMNGHLLGAAIILVQISFHGEKDINLLFTGDYKPHNIFFDVKGLPEWVQELPLTVVTESTYGYMDTTEVSYHMEKDLVQAIKAGKTVLITVFAQGRTQEILYLLKDMQRQGKISEEIPIRLDGNLAQQYTYVYKNCDLLVEYGKDEFLPKNISMISKENRMGIIQDRRQQIILTTSGMADHGPAQLYLENWVSRKDILVYIPGYTSPDTLGYKLQHPINGKVIINGKDCSMNAEVITTSEWSSHAKADEIIKFLQQFKHLNMVLINHGQFEVKDQFAQRVIEQVKTKHVGILGETTYRISCYGYVKHMGAKLKFPEMQSPKLVKEKRKKERETKRRTIRKKRNHHP